MKNYDNMNVKFNVVPAGPQAEKSFGNIQTVRAEDFQGAGGLRDFKSFRSLERILTPKNASR
jgi:hypothetical protein